MTDFTKNLADKLKAAKSFADQATPSGNALAPASLNHSGPPISGRLDNLRAIATNVVSSMSEAEKRAIGKVDGFVDGAAPGSPLGIAAFFRRLGLTCPHFLYQS
jgi:hypothetical protein